MAEITKSLASTRERRANAGANMSRLLDKEEEDEFYKTHYGGFLEVENDNDFSVSDSSDSENVIDSDFDIDENADVGSDEDHEEQMVQQEEKRERRAAVKRKTVYREPIISKQIPKKTVTVKPTTDKTDSPSKNKCGRPRTQSMLYSPTRKTILRSDDSSMYKNLRESTKKLSRETKENLEDERRRKLKSKNKFKRKFYRQPTQEERLREVKRTEIENMRSLEAYKNLEIEKSKRNKMTKKTPNIPMIRYHSYTDMIENDDGKMEPCYRTIISFPNDELFDQCFSKYLKNEPVIQLPRKHNISVLSNLPVRYKDPLTEFPYAKSKEFSVIREAYVRYLEQSSLKDDPSVKPFIEANRLTQQTKAKISNKRIQSPNITATYSINHKSNIPLLNMSNEYQVFYKYRTLKKIDNSPASFFIYTTNNNRLQKQQVPFSSQTQLATDSPTLKITSLSIKNES